MSGVSKANGLVCWFMQQHLSVCTAGLDQCSSCCVGQLPLGLQRSPYNQSKELSEAPTRVLFATLATAVEGKHCTCCRPVNSQARPAFGLRNQPIFSVGDAILLCLKRT